MQQTTIPEAQALDATVLRYIAAFNAGDPDTIAALFSENGTVEDPIGTPPHVGREAIARFYRAAIKTGAKLKLEGPVRVTRHHAAFAFSARVHFEEAEILIDVIDTMRFDDAGQIAEMRAYFNTAGLPDFLP